MAIRQYIVPGGRYADEEGKRTYYIPGFGYQTEGAPNIFNETLPESLTANGFLGITYNETLAESLTAGFSYAATVRYYISHPASGPYVAENGPPAFYIPGFGFYNTTSSRSYPVAPAFNSAQIALSESLTAGFTPGNTQIFVNTFPTLMNAPDLTTTSGHSGGGAYGQMSFGTTPFGGGTVGVVTRRDRMAFGADFKSVILAPDLPSSTTVESVGYYGGFSFGTTAFGGAFDASIEAPNWLVAAFGPQLAESLRFVDTYATDQQTIVTPPAANIFRKGLRNQTAKKTPAELQTYMIDWTADLNGDTITSSSWRYSPTDLTLLDSRASSTKTTITLTDGTVDLEYVVTNTITTSSGSIREHSFRLFIEEYNIIGGSSCC